MGSEVAQQKSIQERVTEKIQASFLELIPEETFKAMVTAEIARFNEPPKDYNGKVKNDEPTPLQAMIRAEIKSRLLEQIIKAMDKPEYNGTWNYQGAETGSQVALEVAKAAAPELIQALFAGLVQRAVHQTKESLASMSRY